MVRYIIRYGGVVAYKCCSVEYGKEKMERLNGEWILALAMAGQNLLVR